MRTVFIVAALCATCSPCAKAGAPLVTDDAAIIEAKSCQLEAFIDAGGGERTYWLVPACNLTGNVELAVGVARLRADGEPSSHQLQFQAKTVFHQSADGSWSVGALGGAVRDTGPVRSGASSNSYYAKALLSLYASKSLEVDLNLGASDAFGSATVVAGAAVQYEFVPRATLFVEVFRDERGPGKYQLGARYALVPARLEAYVSYGNQLGKADGNPWWATAGIRINTAAFLP